MSYILVNRIKPMTGLTPPEKAVLFHLADVSRDGQIAFLRIDLLVTYTAFSRSTIKRALRSLERRGLLIPQGDKKGRGTVHVYCFHLDGSPSEPTGELPSLNGASPITIEFLRRWESWNQDDWNTWDAYSPSDFMHPKAHLQQLEMEQQHHEEKRQ